MSDAFYNDMAQVMTDLLTEFGQTVTIKRISGETLDPLSGASGGTTTELSATGVLTDYKSHLIDGTVIQMGDRLLVMDNTQSPLQDDRVTIGGEDWNIINWKTVQPAAVVVGYFIQVRR